MEGVTILNTIEVMASTWGFSIAGLIIGILALLFLIGAIFNTIKNDEIIETAFLYSFAAFGIFVSFICFYSANEYFDYYKYQVTIDDSVLLTEFMEKYEILDQEGLIYIIKEKEIVE